MTSMSEAADSPGPLTGAEGKTPRPSVRQYPDDLLWLEDLDDAELVAGLKSRYEQKQIYTWVGGVLVSVNPYRDVGAFAEELAAKYAEQANASFSSSSLATSARTEVDENSTPALPPHLFAVVASALNSPGQKHALLISGESGAGKTEATRAALSFLAKTCGAADMVRDRLLHSNPVLEAFGNAKTRQNGNSSRFGKFIQVHFSNSGLLQGATLRPYMLEASRVTGELAEAECTYHIFYQIRAVLGTLAGALPGVSLPSCEVFERIAGTPAWHEAARVAGHALVHSSRLEGGPSIDRCLASFEDLYKRMLVTGMTHSQVLRVASVVAAVGLLADSANPCTEGIHASLEVLLGLRKEDLAWFLTRVETSVGPNPRRERLVRSRSEHESKALVASLSQELYSGLFNWITNLIAQSLSPSNEGLDEPGSGDGRRLGLLDLYGFEVFASNGFEQFLINYCNEKIQQLFNRQVFLREAEEYAAEGLDGHGRWKQLTAACDLPALTLLEGEPGGFPGIFGVVNDRSRCGLDPTSCGDGGEVAEAIAAACSKHASFRRAPRNSQRVFGVAHFAGDVFYEARHFVQKNVSAYKPDIVAFLCQSGNAFVSKLFETVTCDEHHRQSQPSRRRLLGTSTTSACKSALNELCATLEEHECRHIRCLRPNDNQEPLRFDAAPMLRQCRYSGLLEATKIRRSGFAHRRTIAFFAARYSLVLRASLSSSLPLSSAFSQRLRMPAPASSVLPKPGSPAFAPFVEALLTAHGLGEQLRVGRNKVFLQEAALTWLERTRKRLACEYALAGLLGWQARRRFRQLRMAAVSIQAQVRGIQTRRAVRSHAAAKAEAMAWEQKEADRATKAALLLQLWWRLYMALPKAQVPISPRTQELWKAERRRGWVSPSKSGHVSPQAQGRSPLGAPRSGTLRSSDRDLRHIRVHRPPVSFGGEAARASGLLQRPAARVFRKKQNEALALSPVLSPRWTARSPRRDHLSPTCTRPCRGDGSAASPPRATLQAQLRSVGRVLREQELPAEKAELLHGALETVISFAETVSVKPAKGCEKPPPWRSPGKSEGWTQPGRSSSRKDVHSARTSPMRSPPGVIIPVSTPVGSLNEPLRKTSPTRQVERQLSWSAPVGFFCMERGMEQYFKVAEAEAEQRHSPLAPMAMATNKFSETKISGVPEKQIVRKVLGDSTNSFANV